MQRTLPVLKWGDFVIVLILLSGIIFAIPFAGAMKPSKVLFFIDNKEVATYPIDQNRTIKLKGQTGEITVGIDNHSVRIVETHCPHRICAQTGAIKLTNSQIVCAPNHLLITISGANKEGYVDGIAR
jgi:hypothetical protein